MPLEAKNVSFRYSRRSPWILKDVNLVLDAGERLALVGPSGYGKTTLSALLSGYLRPTSGQILLDGAPLPDRGYSPVQLIGQHPDLSVDPRWKMAKILQECWEPDDDLLNSFGIEKEWLSRWPTELSGGELQRFCIARVIGPKTRFLICDEISTMLDAITQAQIWRLLIEISEKRKIGVIAVTHDLALTEKIADRIVRLPDING